MHTPMVAAVSKAAYVKAQPIEEGEAHTCHWPGCNAVVPPAMWGCKPHWFALPPLLRAKIWAAYRPGQEVSKDPSRYYLAVAQEAQDWIRQREEERAATARANDKKTRDLFD
jgi:hypothetical protein